MNYELTDWSNLPVPRQSRCHSPIKTSTVLQNSHYGFGSQFAWHFATGSCGNCEL